jgi:hypothetical protein
MTVSQNVFIDLGSETVRKNRRKGGKCNGNQTFKNDPLEGDDYEASFDRTVSVGGAGFLN